MRTTVEGIPAQATTPLSCAPTIALTVAMDINPAVTKLWEKKSVRVIL
jgi:hypothetical protein